MFWFYFEICMMFLWQLPQNIVALVMLPFLGKIKLIRYNLYTFVYECEKMKGGISLGNFIFLSPSLAQKEASILHELGHTLDSHRYSWLYLFIIGIPSICWAMFRPNGSCYYDFYTERRANKNAGLKVGRNQYSCYIYVPKENE